MGNQISVNLWMNPKAGLPVKDCLLHPENGSSFCHFNSNTYLKRRTELLRREQLLTRPIYIHHSVLSVERKQKSKQLNIKKNKEKLPRLKEVQYKGHLYRVSSNGRVVFVRRGSNGNHFWYRLTIGMQGFYMGVDNHHLRGGKSRVACYMLVAIAYCKGRKPGLLPHHKDHDKLNDHYRNLEWITHSQNIKYAHEFHKQRLLKIKKLGYA
jgi:hypothetical protein